MEKVFFLFYFMCAVLDIYVCLFSVLIDSFWIECQKLKSAIIFFVVAQQKKIEVEDEDEKDQRFKFVIPLEMRFSNFSFFYDFLTLCYRTFNIRIVCWLIWIYFVGKLNFPPVNLAFVRWRHTLITQDHTQHNRDKNPQ